MGYMHISNLYTNREILNFKECYAMCKVHGSSAHISFTKSPTGEPIINFFSGGAKHDTFVKLFDPILEQMKKAFIDKNRDELTIFGEVYGGRMQGMSYLYGTEMKFIAFDVKIGFSWLDVPIAEQVVKEFGIEFVPYVKTSTDLVALDALRDAPCMLAVRNNVDFTKLPADKTSVGEGVVLRPLVELKKNNGERIIAKHKGAKFQERKSQPKADMSPEQMKILSDAQEIAEEWVVEERLKNILSHMDPDTNISAMGEVIQAMNADIEREAKGEIMESKEARKAISKKTAELFKEYLQEKLKNNG
jgi:Rnl2 family RNA ligase